MGFLDDVKKGAKDLGNKVSESTDDLQTGRKADQLFRDLGVLVYKAQIGQVDDTDAADTARVQAELAALVEAKGPLDLKLKTAAPPPPAPPAPAIGRGPCATRAPGPPGATRAATSARTARRRGARRSRPGCSRAAGPPGSTGR